MQRQTYGVLCQNDRNVKTNTTPRIFLPLPHGAGQGAGKNPFRRFPKREHTILLSPPRRSARRPGALHRLRVGAASAISLSSQSINNTALREFRHDATKLFALFS